MSEAPERIWIEDEFGEGDEDQWAYGTWDVRNYRGYDVEYVRADTVQALTADNARLQEALTGIKRAAAHRMKNDPKDLHSYYFHTADAALNTGKEVMPDGTSKVPNNDIGPGDQDAVAGAAGHRSDCAIHNAPAYPAGPCDCGFSAGAALDCVCGMGFGPCKDPECKAPILTGKEPSHE
jgi:hypothetical protein